MMDSLLTTLYNDYTDPSGLSSVKKLYDKAKRIRRDIKISDVKSFLQGNLTYTLHHPARRHFKRNRMIVSRPRQQAQADLLDFQSYSSYNDGYRYMLSFIDCFSKIAFGEPLKNKTQVEVAAALDSILSKYRVSSLQCDRGAEFIGKPIEAVMKKYNVKLFYTSSEVKASIVERWHRTIKGRMNKMFTARGSRRWIDQIQDLINAYNHSIHRTIGMSPASVTPYDSSRIFRKMFKGFSNELDLRKAILKMDPSKAKFKIGDVVRLKYDLAPFEHRYLPNYTDCYFIVSSVIKGYPRLKYKVVLYENKKPVAGSLYEEELQLVKVNEYRVKPIATKMVRRRKKVLLRFLGYPREFDRWYDAKDPMVRRLSGAKS